MVDDPRMPRVGQAVGRRYRIESVLGEGGFGAVYLATDQLAGGRLALKVLDPQKSDSPDFVKRFQQEVRVVRSLQHHNTIKIWDVGRTEQGCLFMAMELVDGEPLTKLIERESPFPADRVVRVGRQILLSLAEAHQKGVVHRDLKPDNVMIQQLRGEPDYVKVLDFGIAKAMGEMAMVKTQTGMVLGTAAYAAPELLRGRGIGPATDLYALGLILLEMLTGEPAVSGDSLADVIVRQMSPQPHVIPSPALASPLGPVIERAIAKDLGRRFSSAEAMLDALLQASSTQAQTGSSRPAPPSPASAMPAVGDQVAGRYHIERSLGQGGFANVYLARDAQAGGYVALKIINPLKADALKAVDRFRQEVALVRQLRQHNTIKIWDFGTTEVGAPFMAMEYVDGLPLDRLVETEGPLSPGRVTRITIQILRSLSEAHHMGIVHRDLKPGNIIISQLKGESDYVKVLDFGIAKALSPAMQMVKTQTGTIMCTPSYAAPEVVRGRGVGPAADIYALGLLMVLMLTGEPAVKGDSVRTLLAYHMSPDPVPTPPVLRGHALEPVLRRAVEKDVRRRFRDADEMLEAIAKVPLPAPSAVFQSNPRAPALRSSAEPHLPPPTTPVSLERMRARNPQTAAPPAPETAWQAVAGGAPAAGRTSVRVTPTSADPLAETQSARTVAPDDAEGSRARGLLWAVAAACGVVAVVLALVLAGGDGNGDEAEGRANPVSMGGAGIDDATGDVCTRAATRRLVCLERACAVQPDGGVCSHLEAFRRQVPMGCPEEHAAAAGELLALTSDCDDLVEATAAGDPVALWTFLTEGDAGPTSCQALADLLDDRVGVPLDGAPILGPADAAVTVVEFTDFQCEFCAMASQRLDQIIEEYPGQIRLAYHAFPLGIYEWSEVAAEAALAAHQQGQFWQMRERIFAHQDERSEATFMREAGRLGLDMAAFRAFLEGDAGRAAIQADVALGESLGVRGTPTLFFNGRVVNGAVPLEELRQIVSSELAFAAEAEAVGVPRDALYRCLLELAPPPAPVGSGR
jgi:serine/threonine protein kinase/protein-disulfide isomerase